MTLDAIFVGGELFSAGWPAPRRAALGVQGGRIVIIDDDDDVVRRQADSSTRVVDITGRMLMPAFHDAHAHPVAGAVELLQCDVSAAQTAQECLATIAEYARTHSDEEWILGGGWTMSHFVGGVPTRQMLDEVVPDRPVALHNRDHHGMWLNSIALERAGITRATADPADGRIERDENGAPGGVLHEGAAALAAHVLPSVPDDLAARALIRAEEEFFALGIAGWQDAYVGATGGMADILDVYLDALDRGTLRARVTAALWWDRTRGLEQLDELIARRDVVERRGRPDLLVADTVKIMVDGVAENYTAALSAPYRDACGHATVNSGILFFAPADLTAAVLALDGADFHIHFHALGDRAVTVTLDALAEARARHGARARRHHLAHLQMVGEADIPRFAEVGAAANLQMLWAAVDPQLSELTFPFVAPELIERHYPFRELHDAGADLVGGSDWPVSSADPLLGIHVGVNRSAPGQGADPRIRPDQALDLSTAIAAYTAGSAAIGGREHSSGRLAAGYLADVIVLDRNPFGAPVTELFRTRVDETWIAGTRVWSRT